MEFKIGNEVEIVTPFADNGGTDNFNRDKFSITPSRIVGKIKRIKNNEEIILDINGKDLIVHPLEIKHYNETYEFSRVFGGTLVHPLIELSKNSPVFVLSGKVYATAAEEILPDKKTRRSKLVEIGPIETFDELVDQRAFDHIRTFKTEYINSIRKRLLSNVNTQMDSNLDIPQLIYKLVFPYLRDNDYESKISKLISGESKEVSKNNKQIPNLEQLVDSVYSSAEKLISDIQKENTHSYHGNSLLLRAVDCSDIGIIGDRYYSIVKSQNSQARLKINFLDNLAYSLEEQGNLNRLLWRYYREYSKKLKVDAVKENFSEKNIVDILKNTDAEIYSIRGKDDYSEKNFGFFKLNRDYFVFLNVPPIKFNLNGRKMSFGKDAKVCVRLQKDSFNGLGYGHELLIKNPGGHYFAEGSYGHGMYSLCPGSNEVPSRGRDIGDIIAKRLRRAKEIVIYGAWQSYRHNRYDPGMARYHQMHRGDFDFDDIEINLDQDGYLDLDQEYTPYVGNRESKDSIVIPDKPDESGNEIDFSETVQDHISNPAPRINPRAQTNTRFDDHFDDFLANIDKFLSEDV
ncbi:Uncharacterised protein [uncultured archaeon]|nr:Uncharacterised protein [uncultured archaeon]